MYPFFRKNTPARIPATNPIRPKMALKSPPARRRIIRNGQPRNIRQPIMTNIPITKRVTGAEPPLGLNSFIASARIQDPSTRPTISGRIYCTAAALWNPSAPVVSRRKQAMQNPMFAGFPKYTSATAMIPMMIPAPMMNGVSFFDNVSFILFPP